MCKVLIIFTDPNQPPVIRPFLKGIETKFFKPDTKKLESGLTPMKPEAIALEAACPKMVKKIMGIFPKIPITYVGGTSQQIRDLPQGVSIVDNWLIASENLRKGA